MSTQPTSDWICSSCRESKSANKLSYQCGICQSQLCKRCTVFSSASSFSFLKKIPDELQHQEYCNACYQNTIVPARETYDATMERAKKIFIFEKSMRLIPLISSSKQKLSVEECADRDETILRLAFQAAQLSFNAVIKLELVCKKVRINGYQTSSWSATGFPANIRDHGTRSY